jgi:hypothetical protein
MAKSVIAGISLPDDEKERPGSQTSALPSTGSTEAKAVTRPHSAAFGMSTRRKPTPISVPCSTAVSVVPTSVA